MADPKFVRLSDRLSHGGVYDTKGSGWSIAGLDVKPMPDKEVTPVAYEFVKDALRQGKLEGASQAEYDEAHEFDDPYAVLGVDTEVEPVKVPARAPQETELQEQAAIRTGQIRANREGSEAGAAYAATQERRKATIKAQKSSGKGKAARKAQEDAEAAQRADEEARAAAAAAGGSGEGSDAADD